jgi:sigma-B regulation protein RsbU (phosphoserine phosphatase)
MKVLIADDDDLVRSLLEMTLKGWGYEVISCRNGREALAHLQSADPPPLAILDWVMPELSGPDVCRAVRGGQAGAFPLHLILLTANDQRDDIVKGLEAGADDYVTKPFHPVELKARLESGLRVVKLETSLRERVHELEAALDNVKLLQGFLPICCYCHKIRDDADYWHGVEGYLSAHSDLKFSHGICPECFSKHVEADMNETRP